MMSNIKGSCHVKEIGKIDSLFSTGGSFDYRHLYIPTIVLGGCVRSDWDILTAFDILLMDRL